MSDPEPYPQIQCCGTWIDYPKAGESTSCPECKSVFVLREETTKDDPRSYDPAVLRRTEADLEGKGPHVIGGEFMRRLAEDFEGETE